MTTESRKKLYGFYSAASVWKSFVSTGKRPNWNPLNWMRVVKALRKLRRDFSECEFRRYRIQKNSVSIRCFNLQKIKRSYIPGISIDERKIK